MTFVTAELADLLLQDGMPKKQRDIHLIICDAGGTAVTKKATAKAMKLRKALYDAQNTGNVKREARLMKEFKIFKQNTLSEGYTFVPLSKNNEKKMALLFAAQLADELKNLKDTHFRIISYSKPVSQVFPPPNLNNPTPIWLDEYQKNGKIRTIPAPGHEITWR
jgi:hypothetical protein